MCVFFCVLFNVCFLCVCFCGCASRQRNTFSSLCPLSGSLSPSERRRFVWFCLCVSFFCVCTCFSSLHFCVWVCVFFLLFGLCFFVCVSLRFSVLFFSCFVFCVCANQSRVLYESDPRTHVPGTCFVCVESEITHDRGIMVYLFLANTFSE